MTGWFDSVWRGRLGGDVGRRLLPHRQGGLLAESGLSGDVGGVVSVVDKISAIMPKDAANNASAPEVCVW
jgi:hypothetical protein